MADADVINGARQQFAEQIAFFRQKMGNRVPTRRWDDLQGAACHVAAVAHKDVVEVGAGRVIFLYYLVVIHRLF